MPNVISTALVIKEIQRDFFLLRKRSWQWLIGGAVAFLLVAYGASSKGAKDALQEDAAVQTKAKLDELLVDATADSVEIKKMLQEKRGLLPPVGAVLPYCGETNDIPAGWTVCDGKLLDESTGFKKDQVAESWWGKKVPNMTGRMLRGREGGQAIAAEGGSAKIPAHSTKDDGKHKHSFDDKVRELGGVTGGIALKNDKWNNPGKYHMVDVFGADHPEGTLVLVTMIRENDKEKEYERGKGQHQHTLDGNGHAKSAGTIETGEDGAHSHEIDEITYSPNYVATDFIIRIK